SEPLRNDASVSALVLKRASTFITNRECLDPRARFLRHDRHHRARVYAARQKGAQRDLAHQVALHAVPELSQKALLPLRGGVLTVCLVSDAPIAVLCDATVLADDVVRRRQLGHVTEDGGRSGNIEVCQIPLETRRVEFARKSWHSCERLQLGSEVESPIEAPVVQGLDAESIACDEQPVSAFVPQRVRE